MRSVFFGDRHMVFMHGSLLTAGGPVPHATGPVIAGMAAAIAYTIVADICILDSSTYMPYSGVVVEMAALPSATIETITIVTESIVDATIITDMLSPIAAMPAIVATIKAPIARSPK
jgi:hypothetical protein